MPKLNKSKLRLLFPFLVFAAAVAIAVALFMTRPRPQPVQVTERAWLVSTQTVRLETRAPHAILYGRLESLSSAELRSAVAADVLQVNVVEGEQVAAGTLLLRLDERDARLRLSQVEADVIDAEARVEAEQTRYDSDLKTVQRERRLLQLARDEVTRQRDLLRKQLGSQSALDNARQALEKQALAVAAREQSIAEHPARLAQAEAALKRAHAQRDQAALDLERCRIKAPFAGRISKRLVSPGRRVRVGDSLLRLYDNGNMVLRALIPERHLVAVRAALAQQRPLKIRGELDGQPVTGSLRVLVGEVDPNSGGVAALFDVEAKPALLQEGRFLQVDLSLPPREGVVSVPPEAVYGSDKVYWVGEDLRLQALKINRLGEVRGPAGETRLLIRSQSLRNGMRIVTTQLPNAIEGLLVRVAGGRAE